MELINYGQIFHDTSVLNNNGLLKINLIQPATRFKKSRFVFNVTTGISHTMKPTN